MSNEIDSKKSSHSKSAPSEDYIIEVEEPEKKGFFAKILDRIRRGNDTKMLTSGEIRTFETTDRSIESMWNRASLRQKLMEKIESLNNAIFRSERNEQVNTMDRVVIGKDTVGKDDKTVEDLTQSVQAVERVIPQSQNPAQQANKGIIVPVSKGIINNSKSAKDVREEEEPNGLKLEEIEVEENEIDKDVDSKINESERQAQESPKETISSIEAGEINFDEVSKNTKARESGDERE